MNDMPLRSPRSLSWLLLASLLAPLLPAQVSRYELGLRLRAFDRELAATADAACRRQAFVELERAVQAFFQLDTTGVAAAVDRARQALRGKPPTAEERWAVSLQLQLPARLCATGTEVPATLSAIVLPRARDDDDDNGGDDALAAATMPQGAEWIVSIGDGADASTRTFPLAELPLTLALPTASLGEGDHALRFCVRVGDREFGHREQAISLAKDAETRVAALTAASAAPEPATLEQATQSLLARLLQTMQRLRGEETILPGARLLAEAEALRALEAGDTYYGPQPPGQFWLRVPAADNAVVRIAVPAGLAGPVPIVVALHGAGGSENLFCDGYGDGEVVRQCARRGWLLAAPRTQGMTGVDVPTLVDALAERYPIDKDRVFAIGHSMGAMQLLANTVRAPQRYRAVAALSGGGAVRKAEGMSALPFFVAAGSRDFGLPASRSLHARLQQLGAPSTLRVYDDVEHLAIVQVSLPDVFAFFDQHMGR